MCVSTSRLIEKCFEPEVLGDARRAARRTTRTAGARSGPGCRWSAGTGRTRRRSSGRRAAGSPGPARPGSASTGSTRSSRRARSRPRCTSAAGARVDHHGRVRRRTAIVPDVRRWQRLPRLRGPTRVAPVHHSPTPRTGRRSSRQQPSCQHRHRHTDSSPQNSSSSPGKRLLAPPTLRAGMRMHSPSPVPELEGHRLRRRQLRCVRRVLPPVVGNNTWWYCRRRPGAGC